MITNEITPSLGWDDVFMISTQDGSDTLYSRKFNATYHSTFGAVGESKHVFLQQGLQTQLQRSEISILEMGFGTGLNALLSYLFGLRNDKKISYTGIESFPIEFAVAQKLNYPEYLSVPEEREIFLRMHKEDAFENESYHFSKINALEGLPLDSRFNCIFFDAFSPADQPVQWEQPVFDLLFQITSIGGCLVTYCAQGEVRRRMIKSGYTIERIPGPPGKREMLRATR
jgi:tRNA U34 5-methylaminomethyl-2-thiouridine-forming methyltransferase MnmC